MNPISASVLHRAWNATRVAAACLLVAACVTINVYFPAAAAEKAADQIIDAVTGGAGGGAARPQTAPLSPSEVRASSLFNEVLVATVGRVLYAVVPAAQAQEANLDISSPEIRALTASMSSRFGQLQKYFDSGVVGMTQNGLIEVRDASAAPLPERPVVTRLVAEDNRDRESLYSEIAKANGHPEWAADIRKTFARRWVERGARAGWYYQNASGGWVQK
ncbi:MAG: YdbL family protein [Steroidobacteraceae bacterium]